MKKLYYSFFLISIVSSITAFSQELSYKDLFISSIDSLVNKQLEYQKTYRNTETLVFLMDSSIVEDYDDLILPCENQPIKSYYTYDDNGFITVFESKDTPEEGCIPFRYKTLFDYEDYKLIERLFKIYNFESNEWENNSKTVYLYDEYNNIIEELSLIWNSDLNIWKNNSKTVYQYDENNNEVERLKLNWNLDLGVWENSSKTSTFFENSYETESNRYNWDIDTNDWFWNLSETNSYDSNNNLLEYIYKVWDYGFNGWEALRKTTHSYDSNGNVLEFVDYRKYESEDIYEWNNIFKNNYSYDENNFLIERLYYSSWNNELADWESIFKYTTTNDNLGNPTQVIALKWDFNIENWENFRIEYFTYNTNNSLTEKLTEKWNIDLLEWEIYKRVLITYNEFNNKLESEEQYYSIDDDYWYTESKWTYEYDEYQNLIHNYGFSDFIGWNYLYYYSEYDITLNTNENEFQNSSSIIPNPTNGLFSIKGLDNDAQLLLFDIGGKLVLDTIANEIIDISTYQKGVYFVKIISGSSVAIKKVIKN
jgi:hypothetical protein